MARRTPIAVRIGADLVGILVLLACVFPVYWMVSRSFLPRNRIKGEDPVLFPWHGTLANYRKVLGNDGFGDAMVTSLSVTLLTVVVAILFAFLAAVAVSRFRFRGRRTFILTLLLIQMIPAEALFISQYKMLDGMGLLNSVVGLTLVYVAGVLPFTVWTLRGFVDGVPRELEEAAMMDGCSRTGAFFRVTLPLLAPGLVATGVFGFIQAWNEFTLAVVVMTDPGSKTLPVWLVAFTDARSRGVDWGAIMASSTLITIPVIVFFLLVQRRMVTGLTAGAVKG
ncbi:MULTISPECIES: carbohydrate ABC transporter permease [unclassified Nocardioides]|uniref:carbohydrate ABC transporter permease n=1 Tax=unclassified Nocardioides TaxID=2615069 RepID=UPI00114E60E5|nr:MULTISPECIES: carbohydrate ABC transporter permease [unclassified Nocardioides]TQK69794.1 carbohydrate ABC transporter membrane protein 2 (CUT1 family) [Nocardioides sp. SLBN-35]WGY00969.1 carbohydrate ABC transporter permease [Nocardioides sp. QY071]